MNFFFPVTLLLLAVYAYLDSNDNFLIGLAVLFGVWLVAWIFDHFRRFFPKNQ